MLEVRHLAKSFGGVAATRDVSIAFPAGSLTAIIGPNGAGKTTFFNLISGHVAPDAGRVVFDGRDIVGLPSPEIVRLGLVRAFQVAALFPTLTAREALAAAATSRARGSGRLLARFPGGAALAQADAILDLLGLGPVADTLSGTLSHGDQKLLDIGLALAMRPKMLLLDEPTAGMGPDERWRMIDTVRGVWRRERLTVAFIEHDMDIVFEVAERLCVLRYGALLAEGTPAEIRANQAVIDAYLGAEHAPAGDAPAAGPTPERAEA